MADLSAFITRQPAGGQDRHLNGSFFRQPAKSAAPVELSIGSFSRGSSSFARYEINCQNDDKNSGGHAHDQEPIIFQESQDTLAVKNRQRAFRIVTDRARQHDCQQEATPRKLQSTSRGHENLERHRRRQERWDRQRQNSKASIRTLDAQHMIHPKATMEDRSSAPTQDRIQQEAAEHRTYRREQWKNESSLGMCVTTRYD